MPTYYMAVLLHAARKPVWWVVVVCIPFVNLVFVAMAFMR